MSTWPELVAIVEAFHTAEGADKNDSLYRSLANMALGELSTRIGHFETHWNNDSTDTTYGTLELSGRNVIFPGDLIDLEEFYWNGIPLTEVSLVELSGYDVLWRNTAGIPTAFVREARGLALNREPTGSTDGLAEAYGTGSIPQFSGTGTVNPLTYLPAPHKLLPAQFMIANLPINLTEKTDKQIAVMQEARAKAEGRWATGSELCLADMMRRKLPALSGD